MADHQQDISRTEVELLSTAINAWVIRTPGRRFPALVIQGDTLFGLLQEMERLLTGLRIASGIDPKLVDSAQYLRDSLDERLQHFESVLQKHGIGLPYSR